jgi:hypothetical protein
MLGALRDPEKIGRALRQIAGAIRGHHHDGGGAVVLQAAVEEPERLHDPARGVVGLGGERPAVHHGSRVALRMMIRGQGNRPLCACAYTVLVHEAHHPHGEALGGGDEAVGKGHGLLAGHRGHWRRRAEALELPLGERAEHHHAVGHPARHRGRRVAHRGRAAASTAAPLHVGEAQGRQAQRGGDARGIVPIVAVRGEAIDFTRIDARVRAGLENRLQRELELGRGRLPVLVVRGLADAGEDHLAA